MFTNSTTALDDLFFVAGPASGSGSGSFTVTPNGTVLANSLTLRSEGALTISGGTGITLGSGGISIPIVSYGTTPVGAATINTPLTLTGAQTWTNQSINNLTIGGQVTGAQALTVKGRGAVVLSGAAANSFASVTIGDSIATGSLGGRLNATSQNALGTSSYAINYGGTLNPTGNFSPSNIIAVNNGGTYAASGATGAFTAFGAGSTIASGATIQNTSGQTLTIASANVALPSAGALFFNTSTNNSNIVISGALPTPTGTLSLGGVLGNASNNSNQVSTTAPTSITSDTTLAFNDVGFGGIQLNGVTLGANLNLAGSTVSTIAGATPQSYIFLAQGEDNIGAVTETGSRAVSVNLAPSAQIFIGGNTGALSTAYTGGTTVNSGYLSFLGFNNGVNTNGKFAGGAASSGVTLNGGWFRVTGNNGSANAQDNFAVGPNGGGLDAFATNGNGTVTFSGNVTKSGAGGNLTLRSGGMGTAVEGLNLSGNNSTFDTGYTLATTNGAGRIQFSGTNSLGASANVITAPSGVAFGFDAAIGASAGSLQSALSRFNTNTGAILVLDNLAGLNIDLSNSGGTSLNKDIQIGSFGDLTFSGSITPYGNTYNFTPTNSSTLTLNQPFQLTDGAGPKNLNVSAGTNAPGATGVASGTVQITAAADYTGSTVVTGTLKNSLGGGTTQGSTLQVGTGGNIFGTSGVTVDRASNLKLVGLDGSIGAANIGITVKGGSTIQIGDTTAANNNGVSNRIDASDSLTLGGNTGGGTLTIAFPSSGAHTQVLNSLNIGSGASTVNTVNTTAGTLNLTFNGAGASNYIRSAGGAVNFALPNATAATSAFAAGATTVTIATGLANVYVGMPVTGTGVAGGTYITSYNSVTGALGLSQGTSGASAGSTFSYAAGNVNIGFTTTPSGSSVIGGVLVGATTGNGEFVSSTGSRLTLPTYTYASNASTWVSGANIAPSINTAFSGTVPMVANAFTINSLRSSAASNGTITIGTSAADTLTIATGMISHSPNSTLTINGPGSLATGNGQDYFANMLGTTTVTIAAKLSSSAALSKVGTGTLVLNNAANAITDSYISGGVVFLGNSVTALGSGGTVNLTGGGLKTSSASIPIATFSNGYSLVAGPQGGLLQTDGASTLNFNGPINLNGRLTVSAVNTGGVSNINLGGNITGEGSLYVQGPQAGGGTTIATLSGNNSAWTGGLNVNRNLSGTETMIARLDNANAAGSGAIVGAVQTGLYFTGNMANANVANMVTGFPVLVNWATANPVTLSGGLYTANGLNVQGYAASSTGSELVLSGPTSISGAGQAYNWSSTPSASIQNFVNGQGGITVGSTGYQGTTALTGASASASNNMAIDSPAGGKLTAGAVGFLRFDGANSFIPGNVGPGYLAALHQANDATDYGNGVVSGSTGGANNLFGFGLTGSGAGTTYALPEGKSFLIGSIGNSVTAGSGQVGGTLYSTGTGTNTAILIGSPKLSGFDAGDVNIHGNAVGDSQILNISAKTTGDTLQIGTAGNGVVFSPTYGDSGATGSVTLLATRTGATAINKIGSGTLLVQNAHFNAIGGAPDSAKSSFSLNVNGGTLRYNQVDAGAKFAALNVATGATLAGSGSINSASNTINGILAPGNSLGTLSISDSVVWNSFDSNDWKFELGAGAVSLAAASTLTDSDLLNIFSGSFLKGTDTGAAGYAFDFLGTGSVGWYKLVDWTGSTTFAATDFTATNLLGSATFVLDGPTSALYLRVDAVPEPSTYAMLACGLVLVTWIRRRSRIA